MKRVILVALCVLFASMAWAQPAQTVTVAQNQSLSPVINLAGTGVVPRVPLTGMIIMPPSALESTSYEIILYACADPAGANCMSMADSAGNLIKYIIVGGATPTSAMVLDPTVVVGLWWFKFRIAASNDTAVSQTTASRSFIILSRTL